MSLRVILQPLRTPTRWHVCTWILTLMQPQNGLIAGCDGPRVMVHTRPQWYPIHLGFNIAIPMTKSLLPRPLVQQQLSSNTVNMSHNHINCDHSYILADSVRKATNMFLFCVFFLLLQLSGVKWIPAVLNNAHTPDMMDWPLLSMLS